MNAPVITVDGPSGSGKGTLCALLAKQLGWNLLDSGALYRLLAFAAGNHGIDLTNEESLKQLAAHLDVQFIDKRIILEGEEVTDAIRNEQIGAGASMVASLPAVREALLQRQRAFREMPGLVADGRDMGTVVFADAPLKIFLTASAEERARRRYLQSGCLRKWRARAMLMRPLESHRRVSSFTRPPASMRLPWPQCRPHCKNASCAPSLLGACWRTVTPKTCWATNTAASRWTPVSASKPTTALRWSGCCAIARVHRFPWSAYAKREANWCTAVPNSAASPPVTSVVPRQMSCTSHRWN